MKFASYEPTVIAPTNSAMGHFQLESSSVIKTAPSRQTSHFSPKHEPIELAPLAEGNLQDLGKMQPTMEHYYTNTNGYPRIYNDYMNNPTLISAAAAGAHPNPYSYPIPAMFPNGSNGLLPNDWQPASYAYAQPTSQQQQQQPQRNGTTSAIHYASHGNQHPPQHDHLSANDHNGQQQAQQRLYKMNPAELLSPVDSGIGGEISLLEHVPVVKSEFFAAVAANPVGVLQSTGILQQPHDGTPLSADHGHDRRETSVSHREHSPVVIPKLQNTTGFQYTLEAPISTSIRKEDDRMTYVNKGQFYTVTLEYIPDPCKMLKSAAVKTLIMVVFREDKSYDEEIKTWQLWHKRQHSPKQRILEVDAKNSVGVVGQIEEVAHNAVQFCWNPTEQPSVQVSIAVQCLSTDFSTQKGVKGLPLHVQIDTYDEADDHKIPFHRGYCQIKVFCDKGAERKLRDEEKRANRRKTAAVGGGGGGGGRKKSEGDYHESCDRSEFYHMSDLEKTAALFVPTEDFDSRFYDPTALTFGDPMADLSVEPLIKRPRTSERIMIYVRKRDENIFTPLHLVPPSLVGLARALAEKFNVDDQKITHIYKQCQKGVTVKVDDDMLKHYCNQDTFILEIEPNREDSTYCAITLIELSTNNCSPMDCRGSQQSTPHSQQPPQWSVGSHTPQ